MGNVTIIIFKVIPISKLNYNFFLARKEKIEGKKVQEEECKRKDN